MNADRATQAERLVKELQNEIAKAENLRQSCEPYSNGWYWCTGRIDAAEITLLRCGYPVATEPAADKPSYTAPRFTSEGQR